MSYLDPPRLTFVGNFFANVPTLNNYPPYFNPEYPGFGQSAGDWNSNGDCQIQFRNCTVRGATNQDGVNSIDPTVDPVIGKKVTSSPMGPGTIPGMLGGGKLVDLDVDQRRVTGIFGVPISVVLSDDTWVSGTLQTCNMRDFWGANAAASTGAAPMSGVFQSVLGDLKWQGDLSVSPYLTLLKSIAEQNGNQVSIKMILDNFVINPSDPPNNLVGRVVGVIGPYYIGEPRQFVAERRLTKTFCSPPTMPSYLPATLPAAPSGPKPPVPPTVPTPAPASIPVDAAMFWQAPCRVDSQRKKLIVDLGNSVQFQTTGGESVVGQMWPAIMAAESDHQAGNTPATLIGAYLDCSQAAYETTGRISELTLTEDQIDLLVDHRLCLITPDTPLDPAANRVPPQVPVPPQNPWPVLAEERDGRFVDIDNWIMRLNPGESGSTDLYARRFGKPLVGERLSFTPIDIPSTFISINTPINALMGDFPFFVTTDDNGHAVVTVTAQKGPINGLPPSRIQVFSQLYQLGDVTGWQSWGQVGPPVPPYLLAWQSFPVDYRCGALSIVVFSEGPPIPNPTWEDVRPMFSHYARMFPAMREMIDLSNEQMVCANAARISEVMKKPFDDPYYMPVTRDLSAYHRKLMLDYLQSVISE